METYNQTVFPRGLLGDDPQVLKNAHDSYDIFVNDKHIGKKVLMTQEDQIDHVVDFIHAQGVQDVSTNLVGDHYVIKTEDSERVTKIIEAYLQNR